MSGDQPVPNEDQQGSMLESSISMLESYIMPSMAILYDRVRIVIARGKHKQ